MTSDTPLPAPTGDDRRTHIIGVATDLFWQHGFDGVAVQDLVEAAGVNRYGLYQLFPDKKALFLAVLDAYYLTQKTFTMELMGNPNLRALDAIEEALLGKLGEEDCPGVGCLMITTAVETASVYPDVADRLFQYMGEMKGLIQAGICRAQAEGDLDANADPVGLSEIFFALFNSLGVQERMGLPLETIRENMRSAIAALTPRSVA